MLILHFRALSLQFPLSTILTPEFPSPSLKFLLARQSKLADTICLRLANVWHRGIIKLPYKRTSFLSISHSRAPAGYIFARLGDRFSELSFFSLSRSRGRTLSRTGHRRTCDLKTGFIPRRKIQSLSLSLSSPATTGFPIAAAMATAVRLYRIVARIGSHTSRLFRNRRERDDAFLYTCATAALGISRRGFFSLSLPPPPVSWHPVRRRRRRERKRRSGERSLFPFK